MGKLFNIAWKDLLVTFRDPAALLLMLVTPFALTLGMGFAFGGFSSGGSTSGISAARVIIVNSDRGQLGQSIVQAFQSADLTGIVQPSMASTAEEARSIVDRDEAAAALIIPPDLSSAITAQARPATTQSAVEVYRNPARTLGASIVRGIADQVVSKLVAGGAAAQVTVAQLVASGILTPAQAQQQASSIAMSAATEATRSDLIAVKSQEPTGEESPPLSILAYIAPSMPILFLMFTVMAAGRTILSERDWGTLPRLLTTPTVAAQVLGGKLLGIFLVGTAQMGILILASWLLFSLSWGSALGVIALLVALVAAATGWGILVAAYSRTPAQAAQIGTAIALVFAIVGGNFISRAAMPDWLRTAGLISPNAWGVDGFTTLASGGGLATITPQILGLLLMAVILFAVALFAFRRQYA